MNTQPAGLREEEAATLLQQWGKNTLPLNQTKRLLFILRDIVTEPMFLLLCLASLLYFLLGESSEGFMMIGALCFVAAISFYQELRSSHALAALQALTAPMATVIRDGLPKQLPAEQIVPGDVLLVEEGQTIAADAVVLQGNDLQVNEAILTGEAFAVEKDAAENNKIYQGTVVSAGRCLAQVVATGSHTVLGKIGKAVFTYATTKTRLQKQVGRFVRGMAVFGLVAFLLIFCLNFFHSNHLVASLLFGLTIAMSAIPEEIPVAFSSFMALGAYALSRHGIITRQPQTVENLGAVDVICLDKTGTITANKMRVDTVYDLSTGILSTTTEPDPSAAGVLRTAFLASEQNPFDPMEQAIVEAAAKHAGNTAFSGMVKEYPLEGRPPMMTHVYAVDGGYLATAKGSVERLLAVCPLPREVRQKILLLTNQLAEKGERVLGVARAIHVSPSFPEKQDDFAWCFEGLLSFYDPPKPYVKEVLQAFADAGIAVKLLTGDYTVTALSIAKEIGLQPGRGTFTGNEVMAASDAELAGMASTGTIFTRMYPEAKLRVVNSLIGSGKIVAMTGDGVNDAPALKAASIGIALGKGGTAVAQQSADLILTNDDLRKLIEAIRQGRKIYSNLTKAIRYIVSIHIPIILLASLPVLFGWRYPNIFTPVHVIFLELIMGPTCSIFFEREPVSGAIMKQPPRKRTSGLFTPEELLVSLVQGLTIAAGVLLLYHSYMQEGLPVESVRMVVFSTLILSNILLTFADRSFEEAIVKTMQYKNNLALPVILLSVLFLAMLHTVPFLQALFGLSSLSTDMFLTCLFTALLCVGWFEFYKVGLQDLLPRRFTDHKQAFD